MKKLELNKPHEKLHSFNAALSLTMRIWIFITLGIMVVGLILYAVQRGQRQVDLCLFTTYPRG